MSNKFVFVAPMWNASKTLARMLHSIAGQSYENWRIILIDDMSDHDEFVKCAHIVERFEEICGRGKIDVIVNQTKKWEVANVLKGISMCEDSDIVCRIDFDDYLIDLDALTIIDAAYQQTKCDVLWTMHRWGFTDRNISDELPAGADPYIYPWVSSHFKTFRKRLINDVKDENFRGEDGEYIRRAGDQCLMLPILNCSKKHIFLRRIMYHYSIDENGGAVYQTDDAKFQKNEAIFLRSRGFIK